MKSSRTKLVQAFADSPAPPPKPVSTPAQVLLAAADVGLLATRGGIIQYANPVAEAMLGWAAGSLNGQRLLQLVKPEDHARVQQFGRRHWAQERTEPCTVRCVRPDGRQFDMRVSAQLIDFEGQPALLNTLFDVSELTDALHCAELRADMLARSELLTQSGSFDLDWPSGRLSASPGLRAMVGEPRGDRPEFIDTLAWVPADERAYVATMWRTACPGEPFELHHRIIGVDGVLRDVLQRGVVELGAPGKLSHRGHAILKDITAQREAERRIHELANFDELTGLPNRSSLLVRLDGVISLAHWEGTGFALMVIEVPEIQRLRSSMGFGAGDALAAAVAVRLNTARHADEFMAHLGGSAFACIVPMAQGLSMAALRERALQLRELLLPPLVLADTEVFVDGEVGVATYPADATTAQGLLDAAQVVTRDAGKNGGVSFFRRESNAPAVRELQLHAGLRHAIARGELRLVYQPQVCLNTGDMIGVEALLRWKSAEFGEVSPGEFIPMAERTGLVCEIGDWVLRQACQQLAAWQRAGLRPLRVAVNVSAEQFRLVDVAQQVRSVLKETGADPDCLGVELTESSLVTDLERITQTLLQLKAIGVEISLDDFGTGYSSLNHLSRLPIDVVKVDRSFVMDMLTSPHSASIVRAIINMAHGMQRKVIAEGVETTGHLGQLVANGCDQLQGYWYSRPLPPEGVAALLLQPKLLPPQYVRRLQRVRTLLLVEADPDIVEGLVSVLTADGYHIIHAEDAAQGLARLTEMPVDVVIAGQRLPDMGGIEFLRRANLHHPEVVRLMLSCIEDLQSVVDAVNDGAIYRFLAVPWEDELLRIHVDDAFQRRHRSDKARQLENQLGQANAMVVQLAEQLQALQAPAAD